MLSFTCIVCDLFFTCCLQTIFSSCQPRVQNDQHTSIYKVYKLSKYIAVMRRLLVNMTSVSVIQDIYRPITHSSDNLMNWVTKYYIHATLVFKVIEMIQRRKIDHSVVPFRLSVPVAWQGRHYNSFELHLNSFTKQHQYSESASVSSYSANIPGWIHPINSMLSWLLIFAWAMVTFNLT